MAKERTRLTMDLESLFPGDTLKIGDQVIDIRPLGIKQLSITARKLKGLVKILADEGVTLDNYNEPGNLLTLTMIILEQAPEILEESSNIALEDLVQLPIEIIVEILSKVIDVNMQSKEKLEKNSKSLMKKLGMIPTTSSPKQK